MNWNESVYLIKEIEQLIADQTTAIENDLGAGNAIFFDEVPSGTTPRNGDILFLLKAESVTPSEEEEQEEPEGE